MVDEKDLGPENILPQPFAEGVADRVAKAVIEIATK